MSEADIEHGSSLPYVVGLGASAGGLEPLERFFDGMPTDSGFAFVIVQHLSPNFKSLMDQILARHTDISIRQITSGLRVEANTIYLLPPRNNLSIEQGTLHLEPTDDAEGVHRPIDHFFCSLASDFGDRAIAVILSGTGSDGSQGISAIHEAGGLAVVQESGSASFDGMPISAIRTGIVDVICRPEQMAGKLVEFARNPRGFSSAASDRSSDSGGESSLETIFQIFRTRYGIDFSFYKPGTIQRRLERRIDFTHSADIEAYLERCQQAPEELDILYRDLLVEVTEFFRDREAFQRIEQEILPNLIGQLGTDHEYRLWSAGCATGEEAYSLAMIMAELSSQRGQRLKYKIFASDVHSNSMDLAGNGTYSADALAHIPTRFHRYLPRANSSITVSPNLRRHVVFARHDITRDPPFTRIDLISCRNVLIYLEPEVQQRALASFHFGLRVGGVLFLGPSESVGEITREFDALDQNWRIYRKQRDVRLSDETRLPLSLTPGLVNRDRPSFLKNRTNNDVNWMLPNAYEDLLARYVPPSLLVNEFHELVHTFGDARRLLQQPAGKTTLDVTKMVDGELRTAMITALHRADQEKSSIVFHGISVETPAGKRKMRLSVEPYARGTNRLFLVCIEEDESKVEAPARTESSVDFSIDSLERVEELERELDHSRQSLQSIVEELEASNEELQSTNEELIASNEELQSTNEELHSVNEELFTVNAEHQRKISELTNLTDDLHNLLANTKVGTIFLDNKLRIRRFTPSISETFELIEGDLGRSIADITYKLDNRDLLIELRHVLETGEPLEREIRGPNNTVFLNRILPYQRQESTVAGLVLTYDNITASKQASSDAEVAVEQFNVAQRDLQDFAYAVSHDFRAPLRHLLEQSATLSAGGDLQPEHIGQLKIIHSAADRLSSMLDTLLSYSRIETQGSPFQPIELDRLVEDCLTRLSHSVESSQAEISFAQLPTVIGDESQLKTVFYHLIKNAIDYCGDDPPKIHLGIKRQGNHWVVSIDDNGIGIERRHYDRIFVIFQRLGFKSEVAGLGVGLAIARRILTRHKGTIWVESTPGKGSTFFVRLPLGQVNSTA